MAVKTFDEEKLKKNMAMRFGRKPDSIELEEKMKKGMEESVEASKNIEPKTRIEGSESLGKIFDQKIKEIAEKQRQKGKESIEAGEEAGTLTRPKDSPWEPQEVWVDEKPRGGAGPILIDEGKRTQKPMPEDMVDRVPKEAGDAGMKPKMTAQGPRSETFDDSYPFPEKERGASQWLDKYGKTAGKWAAALIPAAAALSMSRGKYGVEFMKAMGGGIETYFKEAQKEQQRLDKMEKELGIHQDNTDLKTMGLVLDRMKLLFEEHKLAKADGRADADMLLKQAEQQRKIFETMYDARMKRIEEARKAKESEQKGKDKNEKTEGSKAFNREIGKKIGEMIKEYPQTYQTLKSAERAMAAIEDLQPNRLAGATPEFIQAYFFEKEKALKDMIDEETVKGLRATMGAQFTAVENAMFRALKYDNRLSPQENYEKQRRAYEEYRAIINYGNNMMDYFFENNGNMMGFDFRGAMSPEKGQVPPSKPMKQPEPKPEQKAKPKQPAIKPGTVMDGYKFKGGDPAVSSNWEKVK